MDARHDIGDLLARGQLRYNLGLGEHRARRRDTNHFSGLGVVLLQVGHPALKHARHHIEEAPRARSTFIVHCKVLESAALINAQHLGILAADVDDGLSRGKQRASTLSMTRQFRERHVGPIEQVAAIARSARAGHVVHRDAGIGERSVNHRARADGAGTRGVQPLARDVARFIHDHALRGRRPDVDAKIIHRNPPFHIPKPAASTLSIHSRSSFLFIERASFQGQAALHFIA